MAEHIVAWDKILDELRKRAAVEAASGKPIAFGAGTGTVTRGVRGEFESGLGKWARRE